MAPAQQEFVITGLDPVIHEAGNLGETLHGWQQNSCLHEFCNLIAQVG